MLIDVQPASLRHLLLRHLSLRHLFYFRYTFDLLSLNEFVLNRVYERIEILAACLGVSIHSINTMKEVYCSLKQIICKKQVGHSYL